MLVRQMSLALLVGCPSLGGSTLADDFEDDLTHVGACADVVFYAYDDADTVLLSLLAPGLVQEAFDAGSATTTTFELPDAGVDLVVEEGSRISDAICDDVIENGGPRVDRTWTATAGTVFITVRPGATLEQSRADLVLERVLFASDGEEVTVEHLEILDQGVGWLAG